MNQYKIETTTYLESEEGPSFTDNPYISRHVDFINAPTPIQAMRKLGLPQILESEFLTINIHFVPEVKILKYPARPVRHYNKSKE